MIKGTASDFKQMEQTVRMWEEKQQMMFGKTDHSKGEGIILWKWNEVEGTWVTRWYNEVVTKFLKKTMVLETFINNNDHAVNFRNQVHQQPILAYFTSFVRYT